MIRSLIRCVPRVFACAALAFAAAGPAYGVQATLIINADNCVSWNLGGSAGAPILTCVTSTGGPPAFACNLTGAPTAPIASGAAVNLTMSCSGGTAPYTYAWTPGGSTAGSLSANPTASTTYSVTARDSANGTSTQSAAVTVSSGGGGGGGTISCSGYTNTVVVDMDWNNPAGRGYTGSIAATDAVVVRFTTGSNNTAATVTGAEYGGQQSARVAFLATSACDFSAPPQLGWGASAYSSTVYLPFTVGPGGGYYAALSPNTTYYVNMKTTGNCSSCGMFFEIHH